MSREKMFALDKRVIKRKDCFDCLDTTRSYDLDIRESMIVPMEKVSKAVAGYVREGDEVLEVGCSTGLVTLMVMGVAKECKIVGIDDNANRLQIAEENAYIANLVKPDATVEFKFANLKELPFPDQSMDIVFSYAKLRTLSDESEVIQVLKEMQRVCRKDGLIYIYDLAKDADEGIISFVGQYVSSRRTEFETELLAAFKTTEIQKILEDAGLTGWSVTLDRENDVNMVITNKALLKEERIDS